MASTIPFSENGGFAGTTFFLFVPTQNSGTGASFVSVFDPSSFDDSDDASSYSYKAEDVIVGRVPTVRRVVLVYRDLGIATITVTISGVNDSDNAVSVSATTKIGTSGATGKQLTEFVDVTATCFRPQLTISRAAGAGPVSIVSASMIG